MTRRCQLALKAILDRVGAAILLIILLPAFLLIVLLIYCSCGSPVFFRQERVGKDGQIFKIWKFRTMIIDADRFLNEEGAVTQDRVTRIGRFLRRFSLDELPQLLNILAGDMSFIGPRPPLPSHVERYNNTQMGRFSMKPGVSGYAQVSGRNEITWSRRIDLDLEYVDRFSLCLDIKIVFQTVSVVLSGRGQSLDRNATFADDLPKNKETG